MNILFSFRNLILIFQNVSLNYVANQHSLAGNIASRDGGVNFPDDDGGNNFNFNYYIPRQQSIKARPASDQYCPSCEVKMGWLGIYHAVKY